MKKSYLAPKLELINVETDIIATSTSQGIKSSNRDIGSHTAKDNNWENIWSN
ncbi:MAG: hypothetical protein IKL29_01415 [Bacteroidaceae bacterium]|nr:hypothetical protein [Bacteroidaceae bacterium]